MHSSPQTGPSMRPEGASDFLHQVQPGISGVEFNKDGNVSRMRSHKGNIPSLPQTKFCPLCPAKFTRSTHLNRHMRTHSNERLHECDRCHSQFTRSDLLSRHKRSCGDLSSAHRSRRKSCQSCAESKVKCDQKQPCSKCVARGRECVYKASQVLHSPRGSTSRWSPSSPSHAPRVAQPATPKSNPPTPEHTTTPPDLSDTFSRAIDISDRGSHPRRSFEGTPGHPGISTSISLPSDAYSTSSGSYASSGTADSDVASNYQPQASSTQFSFVQEAMQVQNQLNALFSNEMFDKFFVHAFPEDPSQPGAQMDGFSGFGLESSNEQSWDILSDFPFTISPVDVQPYMASIEPTHLEFSNVYHTGGATYGGTFSPTPGPRAAQNAPSAEPIRPTPAELQYYLQLFVTRFINQMPIVHGPTFNLNEKPDILVLAMQACGALYVKTPTAAQFIDRTLSSTRDQIVAAFASNPQSLEDRIHLILAVVLLQTIGLFHNRPQQRAQSNVYHGMLVMMARQSGLLQSNASWTPPQLDDLNAGWKNWVFHETAKRLVSSHDMTASVGLTVLSRALSLSYLHDCCHSIFFNIRPTFLRDEVNLFLPCEDALWKAGSAPEWHYVLTQASPYGVSTLERLRGGTQLQTSISQLSAIPIESQTPLILTPFSQFITIHAVLCILFEECNEKTEAYIINNSGSSPTSSSSRPDSRSQDRLPNIDPAIHYMLHNWLQSYIHSPHSGQTSDSLYVFFHDGLPFYWISQVVLLAFQERLPPFAPDTYSLNTSGEAKFCLLKEWFKNIREFLKRGEQGPTLFWDELMKIRIQGLKDGGDAVDAPSGLLEFFHHADKKDRQ